MKLAKSVSEKITFKDVNDRFHSREFSAFREITIPDNSLQEAIRFHEVELDLDLRKQVLTNFLLEGVITGDSMQRTLEPYKQLLDAADKALSEILNGMKE